MNNQKKSWVSWLAIMGVLILATVFGSTSVFAEDQKSAVAYYYEIEHPENQVTTGNAINLKMTPGQKQSIPITLYSVSDKDMTIDLSLNGARTNGSGGLEYGPSNFEKDASMVVDLPEIAKVPESIDLPANQKVTFNLEINMPKEAYSGIVTGGLRFMERGQESSESNSGTEVVNKMAMLVGVTLFTDESVVEPKLDLLSAEAGLSNYHNSFNLKIANQAPKIMSKLVLTAEISKKGQKDVLYKSFKNLIKMAPNSIMNYPILLDGNLVEAGDYTANVVMEDSEGNEWKWTKDFTVTKEQANKLNDESVGIEEEPFDWKLVALGAVIVLLFILIVILLVKNKKKANK